jgi:16S rRNA (cytosine1402-N4)-methyltransferase
VNKEREGASHHVPVLLVPAIAGLNLKTDGWYVDGTLGRGGHAAAILEKLGPDGRLLAIDRDPQAIRETSAALQGDPRLELINGKFSELEKYATERHVLGKVDGLLLDLGVSSPQLDEPQRGFSFRSDGPLDMRMDPSRGQSAADWLASVEEKSLKLVLQQLGEEKFAGRIARAIVAARSTQRIARTAALADIVRSAVPGQGRSRGQKKHPATKTFQAIRIFINNELGELEQALQASINLLRSGGRLCVISFHSLEDRRVKRFMRDASRESEQYRGLPDVPAEHRPIMKVIGKVTGPTNEEVSRNARARSSRLRTAERL